ncbi:MAG: TetR/AcrR family transcriptional regulator [Planctomycetota bacterium]|nr:MAG: TetR/AcrR family transcriptional regulator [Planctomycetota bacterium]
MVRIAAGSGRTRRKDYPEKRRAILRAAAAAFRERGVQNTGMRDIAARAGISTASLYYYFEGKDHLLAFCQETALERMLAAVAEARREAADPPEALRRVVFAQLRCTLGEVDGASAHLEVDALPPALRRRVVAQRDRYERAVRALVQDGMDRGAFRPGDATLITRAILGALNWTNRWVRPDGPLDGDRIAAVFADYLVRGLLP